MKLVSVIIPTFNRAAYLREAIHSVLAQDAKDFHLEIIVVDDGSTDGTYNTVKAFGRKVKYIYQENRGAGAARNRGVKESKGEWIAFLDSDDRWLPYKLSLQFKALEAFPDIKMVHSNFRAFCGKNDIIQDGLRNWVQVTSGRTDIEWSKVYQETYSSEDFGIAFRRHTPKSFNVYKGNLFKALIDGVYAACWTLLVAREILTIGIAFAENYPTWEDYYFFCRLCEDNDIIFLDFPTAEYRGHSGPRLTQCKRAVTLECYLDICKKIYFPSTSANRPALKSVKEKYRAARALLFKEYVKGGEKIRAKEIIGKDDNFLKFHCNLELWPYRLLMLLPFPLTKMAINTKRKIEKKTVLYRPLRRRGTVH